MAESKEPTGADIEKIKKALVSAGILKATSLTADEEANIHKHLADNGIDTRRFSFPIKIICSSGHYCFIVRGL